MYEGGRITMWGRGWRREGGERRGKEAKEQTRSLFVVFPNATRNASTISRRTQAITSSNGRTIQRGRVGRGRSGGRVRLHLVVGGHASCCLALLICLCQEKGGDG